MELYPGLTQYIGYLIIIPEKSILPAGFVKNQNICCVFIAYFAVIFLKTERGFE